MIDPRTFFKSLLVYAICLPMAVLLGYMLANPLDLTTFTTVCLLLFLLSLPMLLRVHYPLMLLAWNSSAVLFFLPGHPQLWLAAIALSLGISIFQRSILQRSQLIWTPQIVWPLLALIIIVVATARATGGFGLQSMGGTVVGGRRYFQLLCAILGFFALAAQRIPPHRVGLYLGLFFLGGISTCIGDFYSIIPPPFNAIFLLFPPTGIELSGGVSETRFVGMTAASSAVFSYMLARYGIGGIFASGKPVRLILFICFGCLGFLGGFRSLIISFILIFIFQFFLEGMHRTRLLPAFGLGLIICAVVAVPFVPKLPVNAQRALAFLPVPIDPAAQAAAQASVEWRLKMWKVVVPQVPQYLWLGKGYSMTQDDFALALQHSSPDRFEEQWGATLAGDYHNGPLSVIIPFGIWGVAAFLWFLAAGWHALFKNYRFGDASLRTINTFLLASFIAKLIMFFFVVGGFYSDMMQFIGMIGLSISLNGGIAKPALVPESKLVFNRFKFPGGIRRPIAAQ